MEYTTIVSRESVPETIFTNICDINDEILNHMNLQSLTRLLRVARIGFNIKKDQYWRKFAEQDFSLYIKDKPEQLSYYDFYRDLVVARQFFDRVVIKNELPLLGETIPIVRGRPDIRGMYLNYIRKNKYSSKFNKCNVNIIRTDNWELLDWYLQLLTYPDDTYHNILNILKMEKSTLIDNIVKFYPNNHKILLETVLSYGTLDQLKMYPQLMSHYEVDLTESIFDGTHSDEQCLEFIEYLLSIDAPITEDLMTLAFNQQMKKTFLWAYEHKYEFDPDVLEGAFEHDNYDMIIFVQEQRIYDFNENDEADHELIAQIEDMDVLEKLVKAGLIITDGMIEMAVDSDNTKFVEFAKNISR